MLLQLPLQQIYFQEEFPKGKHEIVNYAEKNKQKVTEFKEILDTLKEIPDKKYHNMIEIEKAIGHMRQDRYKKEEDG